MSDDDAVLDFVTENTLPDYLFVPTLARTGNSAAGAGGSGKSRFNRPNDYTSRGLNLEDLADFAVHTKCDADQVVELLNQLHDRYVSEDICGANLRSKAYELWGLDLDMKPDLNRIMEEYWRSVFQAYQIYQQLLYNDMVGSKNNETLQNQKKISRVFEVLYLIRDLIMAEQRWVAMADPTVEIRIPQEVQIFKFSPFNYQNNTAYQNLLIYLLRQAYLNGYRRLGEDCYQQITNPDGYNTHAWRRVCSIKEFIHQVVRKESNYEMWLALTSGNNTDGRAADYLSRHNDVEFPVLEPDRHIFSFRNGLLVLGSKKRDKTSMVTEYVDQEFFPFDTHPQPENIVACKYFDLVFDAETYYQCDSWKDISTPTFQKILDKQDLPVGACNMMYIMVGRMCYYLNELDHWQTMPYIQGVANSGKSTVLRQISSFFNPEDVGVMSSNMEHKFWASALYEKFVFLCYEARNDFAVPQGEMQSAISGEPMSVPIKYKVAVSVVWRVPGFMVGNQIPNWIDASGSMTRRLVVFLFLHKVRDADPTLLEKLDQETPALLCKVNMAYLEAVKMYGTEPVWKWWDPYFDETQKKLAEQIHPLVEFFKCEMFRKNYEIGPTLWVQEETLKGDFFRFLDANRTKHRLKWNEGFYGSVFEDEGFKLLRSQDKTIDGVLQKLDIIQGLGVKIVDQPAVVPSSSSSSSSTSSSS